MRKYIIAFSILSFLLCFSSGALAYLVLAEGGPTGQWFNPARNGEGFFIEIINTGGVQQVGIAMFTFDDNGNQLWLVGNIAIDADDEVVQIPVSKFDGPTWGPDYDPGDLNTTPFGHITVRFPTCDSALFQVTPTVDLSSGSYSMVRATDIEGIECIDPPPDQEAGRWSGDGVCLNVAQDGMTITPDGSSCANGASAWTNLNGVNEDTGDCDVQATCAIIRPIEDGSFACANSDGDLITGRFTSSDTANGLAFKEIAGRNEYCVATWTASPE